MKETKYEYVHPSIYYENKPEIYSQSNRDEIDFRLLFNQDVGCDLVLEGTMVEEKKINIGKKRALDYSCNCSCTNSWFEVTGPKKPLWSEKQDIWICKWKIEEAIKKFSNGFNVAIVYKPNIKGLPEQKFRFIIIDDTFINDIDSGKIELEVKTFKNKEIKLETDESFYLINHLHLNIIDYSNFVKWQKDIKDECSQEGCPCCPENA